MKKNKIILPCYLSFLLLFLITSEVSAQVATKRLGGKNRYQTAVAISNEGWKQSNYAVIATGQNFPDAIVVSPLAMKYNAPILLTEKNTLNEDTKKELLRLGTQSVFIVGGQGVITATVESQLKSLNIKVTRLAGKDRYETAVKVAEMMGNINKVILAIGENFPDALSVAPAAAKLGIPILLIQPKKIPESTTKYLKSKPIIKAYIVGDETIASGDIVKPFNFAYGNIYGTDRYKTNQDAILTYEDILNSNTFYVATGDNYADALTCSVLAAKNNSPILYLDKQDWRSAHFIYYEFKMRMELQNIMNRAFTTPIILGGDGVISAKSEYLMNNYKKIADKAYELKSLLPRNNLGGKPNINQIVIDGEWVYYNKTTVYAYSDEIITFWGENAIYKMKLDGSENTRVFFIGGDVNNYTYDYISRHYKDFPIDINITIKKIENNWIYYNLSNDSKSYKIKTDGKEKQKIK
ncbi:cell wall-binding repeat-containing protein [Clostridium bowmanii]|uniref:cell wall-binding repeat-containing protein n=1 Tax=Clostridium bowmanii TaxID=132925 RepID=UPI001C0AD5AD|nr:cell wall-binding repeat-containing protein [Clostridium bowmanii]MBU3188417.1 cell wall-binding repeat-containing protein [Clostridium bowmanii]MCA1072806.1 cell wall-binding repeat-containing protein [Clostridium bowmanii]